MTDYEREWQREAQTYREEPPEDWDWQQEDDPFAPETPGVEFQADEYQPDCDVPPW